LRRPTETIGEQLHELVRHCPASSLPHLRRVPVHRPGRTVPGDYNDDGWSEYDDTVPVVAITLQLLTVHGALALVGGGSAGSVGTASSRRRTV
jgi:hypothetical protein